MNSAHKNLDIINPQKQKMIHLVKITRIFSICNKVNKSDSLMLSALSPSMQSSSFPAAPASPEGIMKFSQKCYGSTLSDAKT